MTMDSNYLRREQQMRNDDDRQTPHTTIETWQIEQENAQQGDIPGEATADVQEVVASFNHIDPFEGTETWRRTRFSTY